MRVALAALLLSCTLVWADVSVDNEREHVGIDAGPSTPARRQARDFGRALDDYQGNRWSRAATPAPVG